MTSTALFGCTGLVGSNILSTLLTSPASANTKVHTISRRTHKSTGPNLNAIVEPDTTKWSTTLTSLTPPPQTVISALGTTRAVAGGIAAQWKIDHDLNVEIAEAAKASGVKTFVFISSAGTRGMLSNRVPYSRMKIGVEDKIKELGFEQAIILRPGLIMGEREVAHQGAWLAGLAPRVLGMVWGQKGRDMVGQEAEVIARAAVAAVRRAEGGEAKEKFWVLEGGDIVKFGRDEWKE